MMKGNSGDIENFIVCRMREAAALLRTSTKNIERRDKEHWTESNDPGFGGIVTKWDMFVQDFIFGSVRAHFDKIRFFGEEPDGIFSDTEISENLTLIVDPIDGTEWFSQGEDDFSILAALLDNSRVIWSAGIFPRKGTIFIGSQSKLSIETDNKISRKSAPLPTDRKSGTIAAHYRLGRGTFRKGYDALTAGGFKILMNGDGFGTNLSALEKFLQGEVSAFIAAKMSIVDGFPIAHLIKSAGGTLRFFDPREDIDIWTPVKEWEFHDFGVNGGKRTRFIAANSEKLMKEIITTLNKQTIRNPPPCKELREEQNY